MSEYPNHVIYPSPIPIDTNPIDQLISLQRYIDRAKDSIKVYKELNELHPSDTRRLFYTPGYIDEQSKHWESVLESMVGCYNSHLESMKIK